MDAGRALPSRTVAHVKRHLLKAGANRWGRAACGLRNPQSHTDDPDSVTCVSCRGSMYFSAYIANLPQQSKNKRTGGGRNGRSDPGR